MKKIVIASALLLISPFMALCQTWNPVTYNISFKVKNAGLAVNGKLSNLKTEMVFNPEKLSSSKLKGYVESATLKTGIGMRDKTIKDDNYLHVDKYKLIEISSVKLYPKGTQYAGIFNVTIKGTTKEMEIPFDFIQLGDEADFNSTFTLNRKDFNVGGNSMTMSDDVTVTIKLKARRS